MSLQYRQRDVRIPYELFFCTDGKDLTLQGFCRLFGRCINTARDPAWSPRTILLYGECDWGGGVAWVAPYGDSTKRVLSDRNAGNWTNRPPRTIRDAGRSQCASGETKPHSLVETPRPGG